MSSALESAQLESGKYAGKPTGDSADASISRKVDRVRFASSSPHTPAPPYHIDPRKLTLHLLFIPIIVVD